MSGSWPPGWEDPGDELPEEADRLDAAVLAEGGEARLSEVTAYLASVPVPALPDAVEARISAALAAEAATRAVAAGQDGNADASTGVKETPAARTLGATPARARVGRHRGSGRGRRSFRLRPAMAGGSLLVFLLLAGLVYGLSRGFSSSASSASSASGGNTSSVSSAAGAAAPAASASASAQIAGPAATFVVTESGTKYQQATLTGQVRARLAATEGQKSSQGAVSAPSTATAGASPGSALLGCVAHLLGTAPPRLVDRATYQGAPAYIIASSSRVWVVGLGCTAAKTELIASVPLAGLPGNLRALISVEQYAANLLLLTWSVG